MQRMYAVRAALAGYAGRSVVTRSQGEVDGLGSHPSPVSRVWCVCSAGSRGMHQAWKCVGMLGWRGFGTRRCLSPYLTSVAQACDDMGHAHAQEVDELYPSIWLYSIVSGRRIDESFQGRKALHRIPEDHVTREVTKPQLML